MRRASRSFLRAAMMCAAVFGISSAGLFAQSTQTIQRGNTYVQLASSFVSALASLQVAPGTVDPSQFYGSYVNFPVTGGAIDLDSAKGQVLHSGGLTLTAGSTQVVLQSFIIDTTNPQAPVISGLVTKNGTLVGRVTLFDLKPPSGVTLPLSAPGGFLGLNGVGVTLDPTAANFLNSTFNTNALSGSTVIGTAYVELFLQHPQTFHRW